MNLELAGCVILDRNKKIYLLHRNDKGFTQWELPGGKVGQDETVEQTALRELNEELGVKVKIVRQLGRTAFLENETTHEYTWFLAEIESGDLKICEPEKFDDLRSFSFDELSTLELSNNMKKLYEAMKIGAISLS